MGLDERKFLILQAIIDDYITTAMPVGSRTISRKAGVGFSPATIRNEMSDLEELGYLNDAVYAAQVVEHYSAKGFGTKRLRDELYRRGIPRELWEEALSQAGEATQAIDAFLRKKLKDEKPDRAALKRVSDALARRGYSWSDISRALSRYQSDPEWTDDTKALAGTSG